MKQIEDKVYRRMFRDICLKTNLLILIIVVVSAASIPLGPYVNLPVQTVPIGGAFVVTLLVGLLWHTRSRMVKQVRRVGFGATGHSPLAAKERWPEGRWNEPQLIATLKEKRPVLRRAVLFYFRGW